MISPNLVTITIFLASGRNLSETTWLADRDAIAEDARDDTIAIDSGASP